MYLLLHAHVHSSRARCEQDRHAARMHSHSSAADVQRGANVDVGIIAQALAHLHKLSCAAIVPLLQTLPHLRSAKFISAGPVQAGPSWCSLPPTQAAVPTKLVAPCWQLLCTSVHLTACVDQNNGTGSAHLPDKANSLLQQGHGAWPLEEAAHQGLVSTC